MHATQYGMGASPSVLAFRSLKAGKNFFMVLVLLTLLAQLAGFVMVNFVGVLDQPAAAPQPKASAATQPAATQPATTQPATTRPAVSQTVAVGPSAKATEAAVCWELTLQWVLPATKFLAFVSAVLAVLTFMFAVKLSIIGRLGGIPGFMSAFFWSLILLAIVTPWQQVLHGAFAAGAMYNFGEMMELVKHVRAAQGATDVQLLDWVVYYARFIAYPALALLVWVTVMVKFASGFKDSIMAPAGDGEQMPAQ